MIKIIGEVGPLKEMKNILSITKIEDFEKIKKELIIEEEKIEENSKEECIIEINNMKKKIDKENIELIKHLENNNNLIRKILGFFNIYNKKRKIGVLKNKINKIENNFDGFIKNKILDKKIFIESKKNQLNELNNIYYGALGEEKVVKTFKEIYGSGILINDFYKKFNEPICTKGCKDRIQSIQIDHIFINESGVFLIETKNWNSGAENIGAYSPIKQAQRHNHAFYVFLKNNFHFRNIPKIYNVVVFTGKYKMESKNYLVNTIRLNQLKNYIQDKKILITKEKYREIADDLVKMNDYYF